MASDPQIDLFKKYIQDKKIVIADPGPTARASLSNTLVQMGAKQARIGLASTFEEAEQLIAELQPTLVICDYTLGAKCGLELIQNQKNAEPEAKSRFFVLVTGNTSQTAVARAAEEDVDSFVIKPYTSNILRNSIMRAVFAKIKPSEYAQTLEKGKQEMAEGRIDEALAYFEEAKKLDASPSLAFAYVGQAKLLKEVLREAEANYSAGLSYNKIHYKCLAGLFDTLMAQKRFHEAYEVSKKLSQYFPANPQRLTQVLRLAIINQAYEDIERYYQVFTKIDSRSDEVISYICAALVVCGKYYLQIGAKSRAFELFTKAAIAASGRTRILREIILALTKHNHIKEAREYLGRFHPSEQSGPMYLALDLWIINRSGVPCGEVLKKGRALLAQGVHEPLIYQAVLERSVEAGHLDSVESTLAEATRRWPEQKPVFLKAAKRSQ